MVELWRANPEGFVELHTLSEKELAATRKGKPIRGKYRALPLNQSYGYHEHYDCAVADLLAQMESRIKQNEMHLSVWVMQTANAKQAYCEAMEVYGR